MDKFFKYTRSIIAFLVVIFSFGFLYLIALRNIPHENRDILTLSAGLILGVLATVAAYYFGSSKDKSDQDKANNLKTP
jgi:hypothetical protein